MNSIEVNHECQQELLLRSRKGDCDSCVFCDVCDFIHPKLVEPMKQLKKTCSDNLMDILKPVVLAGKAVVTEAYCLRHGKKCSLRQAALEAAGTPCQEFSSRGTGEGEHGANMLAFMIWIAIRYKLNNAVILHENVQSFPIKILAMFFDATYFIETVVVEGTSFGWPTARTRRWTVLRHKAKTLSFRSPLNVFTKLFERRADFSWLAYLRATDAELESELAWASGRNTSKTGGRILTLKDPDPFFNALTDTETKIVEKYRELVGKNNNGKALCSLKQNPFTRESGSCFAHFTHDDVQHTVTKNVGLLWVTGIHPERWMTPYEVLLAQCFPVYSDLYGHEHVSFAQDRVRSRNAIFAQSGNSMPLSMSGLFVFYAAIAVEKSTAFDLFADMRSAKRQRLQDTAS